MYTCLGVIFFLVNIESMSYSLGKSLSCTSLSVKTSTKCQTLQCENINEDERDATIHGVLKFKKHFETSKSSTNFNHVHQIEYFGPCLLFKYFQEHRVFSIYTTAGSNTITMTFFQDHNISASNIIQNGNFHITIDGVVDDDAHGISKEDFHGKKLVTNIPSDRVIEFSAGSNADTTGIIPQSITHLKVTFVRTKVMDMSTEDKDFTTKYGDLFLSDVTTHI